jgi:signal transduction histidine kinase
VKVDVAAVAQNGSSGAAPGRPGPSAGLGAVITAWVVIAVGALTGLTLWGQFTSGASTGMLILDVSVGVASCALIPVTLRWPVAGALALSVLAALSAAATPAATVAVLFVAQRRRFAVAVEVAVVGIVAHAIRGAWRPFSGLSYGWWLVLVVMAYAALVGWGALTQARQAVIQSLRERAERAEAEQDRRVNEARAQERARIAREMHDVLAHRLSLLATFSGAIEYRPDSSPEQLSRAAGVIRSGAHQALEELRQVITLLREDELDDGQALQPPQPGLSDLSRLVEESRATGTRVEMRNELCDPDALPASTGRTLYRVVQEGLTNARKHATGQPVDVVLTGEPGGQLRIDVTNEVPGGPSRPPSVPGTGTGLIGLAERVGLAGGQLDYETTAAGQFRLRARLPWPA